MRRSPNARCVRLSPPVAYGAPSAHGRIEGGLYGPSTLSVQSMKRTARYAGKIVESSVPARLDALPWSHFHTLVIVALGITWVLDGLEVTLTGAVSGALKASPSLRLSDAQVGISASAYLAGAVLGAILFGWLTDLFGRKRLF